MTFQSASVSTLLFLSLALTTGAPAQTLAPEGRPQPGAAEIDRVLADAAQTISDSDARPSASASDTRIDGRGMGTHPAARVPVPSKCSAPRHHADGGAVVN